MNGNRRFLPGETAGVPNDLQGLISGRQQPTGLRGLLLSIPKIAAAIGAATGDPSGLQYIEGKETQQRAADESLYDKYLRAKQEERARGQYEAEYGQGGLAGLRRRQIEGSLERQEATPMPGSDEEVERASRLAKAQREGAPPQVHLSAQGYFTIEDGVPRILRRPITERETGTAVGPGPDDYAAAELGAREMQTAGGEPLIPPSVARASGVPGATANVTEPQLAWMAAQGNKYAQNALKLIQDGKRPSSLQERVALFMSNPEMYRALYGDKEAVFATNQIKQAQNIAIRRVQGRFPFGAIGDPVAYEKALQEEFEKALHELQVNPSDTGVAAPGAPSTPSSGGLTNPYR